MLLAYVATAFFAHVDSRAALVATVLPKLSWSRDSFSILVAIFGTTISLYLFFRQPAQEVEEERALGRNLAERKGPTQHHPHNCRDAACPWHDSHRDGAAGRRGAPPARGQGSLPALHSRPDRHRDARHSRSAGSSAYAITEAAEWRGSVEKKPHGARRFYAVPTERHK